jgi:hypothetical protein
LVPLVGPPFCLFTRPHEFSSSTGQFLSASSSASSFSLSAASCAREVLLRAEYRKISLVEPARLGRIARSSSFPRLQAPKAQVPFQCRTALQHRPRQEYVLSQHLSGPLGTTVTNELRGTISLVSFEWLLFDFGERAVLDVEPHCDANRDDRKRDYFSKRMTMRITGRLHAHCPNQISQVSAATTRPTDEHTKSWNGRTLLSPTATKIPRAAIAPKIPIRAHNIQISCRCSRPRTR